MKRYRGFRLGRKLTTLWKWAFRCRRHHHHRSYLRLDPKPYSPFQSPPPPPQSLSLSFPNPNPNPRKPPAMAARIFDWGRHLITRRLRSSGGDGAALIEGEEAKPPPKGHMAVYVGGGRREGAAAPPRRYLVPVIYFNHPLFGELLREAEAEFGFRHPCGGITIPVPVAQFELVRTRIASAAPRRRR
ncbi:auxin-responsive protein SAUR36-like [Ananas comosus]|uniref:Auxin-responsive protein SAUR36 n=1 Tax=Ananas comosus TaxID=4615 RepID=A0A199UPY7_ANACO|nr:auxin-responsive protein SAUR36-like [Ananas comosus]OAY66882.1 Auxin-responsive protein SAUR36 [Ananas comosus]